MIAILEHDDYKSIQHTPFLSYASPTITQAINPPCNPFSPNALAPKCPFRERKCDQLSKLPHVAVYA